MNYTPYITVGFIYAAASMSHEQTIIYHLSSFASQSFLFTSSVWFNSFDKVTAAISVNAIHKLIWKHRLNLSVLKLKFILI